ncbi:unnamed protein product [Caenorhabditis bovis]|uniref:Kinase n=1 Tax=Caenorhabditis bovis TaxID=2654633 RepID=A0A8S1F1G2_9PELO|nr:unnamed protein product [Caenorhabditis bovis]
MGAGSSRRDGGCCWTFREPKNGDTTRPTRLPSKLRIKLRGRRNREETFVWEEVPTPSVCEHRDTVQSEITMPAAPPTQERLMQIISCFPYPTQRPPTPEQFASQQEYHRAFCDAFGKLVQPLAHIHSHFEFIINIIIIIIIMSHHRTGAHLTKIASIDLCNPLEEEDEVVALDGDPKHLTLIRKRSTKGHLSKFRRPRLGDLWHKRYHEASFDLGRRLGIGRRTHSCSEDIIEPVSVETMAITALPMDVWLKERLKKWVQLSGHEGSIVPATPHTLYKKQCANCGEGRAYKNISRDPYLLGFTPKYYNELEKNDEHFIEIEDLLQQFQDPTKAAIMDIKIGTRTFLESEVSNTKKRADLFEKMVAIDPDEPTDDERQCRAITKLRYMQFRERESSTAQLGFRIEAAKKFDGALEKNFKKVRTAEEVSNTFIDFFGTRRSRVCKLLIERLKSMRKAIENSTFFASHECSGGAAALLPREVTSSIPCRRFLLQVVGSSILIVFDTEKVGCWMIDFAKSSPLPSGRTLNHRTNWVPGNNEDGYLIGIDNLIKILEGLPEHHPEDELLITEEVISRLRNSKT